MTTKKLVVLASGSGSNFQAIIDACTRGILDAEVVMLLTDKEDAFARKRAKELSIPERFVNPSGLDRKTYGEKLKELIAPLEPDAIILAGFMRILSSSFVKEFSGRILNIHPALLPKHQGRDGYGDTWRAGDKVGGCTVHFVDEGMDTGPIILQKENPRREDDTFDSFKERGLSLEHKAYPEAIKLFLEGKVRLEDGKVVQS